MIPALQSEVRAKFNRWTYLLLTFMILQTLGHMVLSTECPLYPYEFQDGGARFKSWIALILIPLSQATIDFCLVSLAAEVLRTLLPVHTSDFTIYLTFVLSFVVTFFSLGIKLVDKRYDMIMSLVLPIFKFLPFILSVRDSLNTAYQFRNHLVYDRTDQVN